MDQAFASHTSQSGEIAVTGLEGVDGCWVLDHQHHPTLGITRTGLMLMRATADHASPAVSLLADRLVSVARQWNLPAPYVVVANLGDPMSERLAQLVAAALGVPFEPLQPPRRGRPRWLPGGRAAEPVPLLADHVLLLGTAVGSSSTFAAAASQARRRGANQVLALAAVMSFA